MEFATLLLLILLPAADAGTDMNAAIQATLYKDLGQVAIAVAPDSASSRKAWQEKNGDYRAKYVARFEWLNKRKARIELWRGTSVGKANTRIGTREVTFSPVDATDERGRAIGLVIVQLLRELPEADLIMPKPKAEVVIVEGAPPARPPSANSAVALSSFTRPNSQDWAIGPAIVASIAVLPHVSAQAFASLGLGGVNNYSEIGMGLGAAYFPLQSANLRHGLGAALHLGLYRESAQNSVAVLGSDHLSTTQVNHWEIGITPEILGYISVWKSLQLYGVAGLRHDTGTFQTKFVSGDDNPITSIYTYQAWRPSFSVGVGLAF